MYLSELIYHLSLKYNFNYSDFFLHCSSVKSIESYEMYDSDTILDTMKVKMRRILTKYKDGILCNDFMDIYGVSIQLK